MWICMNDAFVSVVATDDGKLMVRARKKDHLRALFPKAHIIKTPVNDYRFRVICGRSKFAKMVAKRIAEIDYSNFKDSVADRRLHDLYAGFWVKHHAYQQESETVGRHKRVLEIEDEYADDVYDLLS